MKKLLLVIIVLMLVLTGCSEEMVEVYNNSNLRTETILHEHIVTEKVQEGDVIGWTEQDEHGVWHRYVQNRDGEVREISY